MSANWPRVLDGLEHHLAGDGLLILDPPASLLGRLPASARLFSLDYSIWSRLPPARREPFGTDLPEAGTDTVLLFAPRSKDRLAWWLNRLAVTSPGASLWLAGANREGGRGIGGQVESVLDVPPRLVDRLGRASLWQCRLPVTASAHRDFWQVEQYARLAIHSLPGVFGHRGVDAGSALLLEAAAELTIAGRVLDFGCGAGLLGAVIASRGRPDALVLIDSDALAVASARRTLQANAVAGEVLPSDGWSQVSGRFDWIISNPPFHRHGQPSLDTVSAMIAGAGDHLHSGGRLLLVANRHLPLERVLAEHASAVEETAASKHFKVLLAAGFAGGASLPSSRPRTASGGGR